MAQDALERGNCPEGFVFIRTSGTGCVQQTFPPHGRRNSVGESICADGYRGITELRPTTGEIPGNPQATSFGYLVECVPSAEYDEQQSQIDDGLPTDTDEASVADDSRDVGERLDDLAGALASGADSLSAGQGALLAVVGTGALVLAAAPMIRGHAVSEAAPPEPPGRPSLGEWADRSLAELEALDEARGESGVEPQADEQEPARQPVLAADLSADELRQRIETLNQMEKDLAAKTEEYRHKARTGQITDTDLVTWVGIVADFASLLHPGFAGASLWATGAGLLDETYNPRDTHRAIREGLGEMARLRGVIDVQRDGYRVALDAIEKDDVDDQIAELLPDPSPEEYSDSELEHEFEKVGRQLESAWQRSAEARQAVIEAERKRRQADALIRKFQARLSRGETSDVQEANRALSLDSGLVGLAAGTDATVAAKTAQGASVASATVSAVEWFESRSAEQQRVIDETEIARLKYQAGRLDAGVVQAEEASELAHREAVRVRRRHDELAKRVNEVRARRESEAMQEWRDYRRTGRRR